MELKDIKDHLHAHTKRSHENNTADEMARVAKRRGYRIKKE